MEVYTFFPGIKLTSMSVKLLFVSILWIGQFFSFPSSFTPPSGKIAASDDEEAIVKKIVDNLKKKDYEAVRTDFTNVLRQQLTVGNFQEIMNVKTQNVNGYDVVRARCRFQNDNGTVEATFNDEHKVIGLFLRP